jgi:hypothetical protein
MPTDAQTLVNAAKCYGRCIPPGDQLPALISLSDQILNNPGPPLGNFRITEAGEMRLTEAGDTRIIE